jgi:serine/threonine protein phosphatase PrpC
MNNLTTQPGQSGTPASPIRTKAVKLTDVGQIRSRNQDFVAIEIPSGETLWTKGALYLVADGMGGYQAGEVASQKAGQALIDEYYADPKTDVAASLDQAVQRANAAVYHMAQSDLKLVGMGTTVVAAVVRGDRVHVANVGDSRAYLWRGKTIEQITKDHSFVQEQVDADILTPEAARTHPQRNIITRALGHQLEIIVDVFETQLAPGDVLLLCSDGLNGPVRDEEMADILRRHPLPQAVVHLIEMANRRGGPDNISAVLVQALRPDPAQQTAVQIKPGDPTLATAPTRPLTAPRPPSPTAPPGRQRRSFAWGIFGGIALATTILVLISLYVLNGYDDQQPTPTPSPTLPPTTASTSEPAIVPTLEPTQTPWPTDTPAPTHTPCHPFTPALVAPLPGANLSTTEVTFQWEGGALCAGDSWLVTVDGRLDLCTATTKRQVTCQLLPGQHQWRVEIWGLDGKLVPGMVTPPWLINVIIPTSSTPPPLQDQATPQP